MKRILSLFLLAFLAAAPDARVLGEPRPPKGRFGGPIPGVPEWCCGYWDCRPARVQILKKNEDEAVVRVDGRRMVLTPGRVHRSRDGGSWYCFRVGLRKCRDGRASEYCAKCVVQGGQFVQEMRVLPASARARGTHLLLPPGGCGGCHR